jgi:hypothetical protein
MSEKLELLPSIGISLSVNIEGGRSLVFQTHVPQDCSQDALDGLLDKCQRAITRQTTYSSIEKIEEQVGIQEKMLVQLKAAKRKIDDKYNNMRVVAEESGRRTAPKLSEKEAAEKDQLERNINQTVETIASFNNMVAELKAAVGGS